eukprot:Transcript_25276.p2 GENE.Transcript_25276~~Transcript_25276.p2  ORF type:complete len:411 (+),score=197.65 Transcript_25276:43-1233(+)
MDKTLQNELFGSDSEEEEEEEEEVAAPSAPTGAAPEEADEADGDNVGEDDLFGSDEEEEGAGAAPRRAPAPSAPSAPPLHYELPMLPKPNVDSELYAMRLPNILAIEPRPFDAVNFEDEEEGGDEDSKGKADNVIRWRDTEGSGRQSNARIVRWSDGSMTLHVGSEVLSAVPREEAGGKQLFTRHKGSNLECHGLVHQKLVLQPASIKSSTHKALTKRIAKNVGVGERRIQMHTTTQDPEKKKREDEKTWDEKNRLMARQNARASQEYDGEGQELSADFLDADDDIGEGNLGAIKRRFSGKDKKGKKSRRGAGGGGASASRAAHGGKQPRALGRRDESDDGSEDEEHEESEEEADTGEMQGFIVDDEEAEGSESEEEAASSDESEEEARAPKKRRK